MNDRQCVLISDLHLSEDEPGLTQGFLGLLQQLIDDQIPTDLYILGDWFEVWLSDHDPRAWLLPVIAQLRAFTAAGHQVFFLAGNRDFLLGQGFLDRFGGQLCQEPLFLKAHGQTLRLEHGDALCTDDVSYQHFRQRIRQPWVIGCLQHLPFWLKRWLARYARYRSRTYQAKRLPVDVNATAVSQALQSADHLIHGHTHRPAVHQHAHQLRIVLGDWRIAQGEGHAEILLIPAGGKVDLQTRLWTWKF